MEKLSRKKPKNSISEYFRNISNKDKIILCVTGSIIVVFATVSYIFSPLLDKYLNSSDRIAILKQDKSKIKLYEKQNETIKLNLEEVEKTYKEVMECLPKTGETALILRDIERLSLLSGVTLKEISMSEPEDVDIDYLDEVERGISGDVHVPENKIEDEKQVKKQSLFLTIEGNYEDIISLIKSIEEYERISEVSELNITKIDKTMEVEVKEPEEKPTTTTDSNGNINITINSNDNTPKYEMVKIGETLSVNIKANFYNLNYKEKEQYDFNLDEYGKENSFR